MTLDKVFPLVLVALMLSASVVYFITGDVRRGVYWFAGAVLNIAVTF